MVGKSHFLNHEHLIQLHGNWEDQQAIYIIEEYAYGGDLLQVMFVCTASLLNYGR
jgi:hypothetical protein